MRSRTPIGCDAMFENTVSYGTKLTNLFLLKSPKVPTHQVPAGWTTDATYLASASRRIPKSSYGIKDSFHANSTVADRGECPLVLVECPQAKYYLWNELSDDVWEVLAPTKLEDIVPKLGDRDLNRVMLKALNTS